MVGLDSSSETNIAVIAGEGEREEGKDSTFALLTATPVLCIPTDLTQEKKGFLDEAGIMQNICDCAINTDFYHRSVLDNMHNIVKCFSDFYFADCRKSEITYQASIYSLDLVCVRSSYHCWSGEITVAKGKLFSTYGALCCCKLRSRFGLKLNIPVKNMLI